jgi:hypothetical protein
MASRRYPSRITGKQAEAALVQLLYGCTPERLASMTAESLAGSYRVPLATAEKKLAAARVDRG